jgi:predicted GNAT superfamily acetyltransferase
MTVQIRILEKPEEMQAVESLQQLVWPGNDLEIVPVHMLLAATHGGGVVIGAFDKESLVGFVFGFPGFDVTPDGPKPRHCSHMAAVHPDYRDSGIGYKLKRAQWQIVRKQGLDHITWTYDPLQSRNANLNIAKLGAVCNTYTRDYYGELRDGINIGFPSDRFTVDWWVNTNRVNRRLSKHPRLKMDLAHYFGAGASIINPSQLDSQDLPQPSNAILDPATFAETPALLLVEIPADIQAIRSENSDLALAWRLHTRGVFENLFNLGYLITDFVFLAGKQPRSFYVLSHGEATF